MKKQKQTWELLIPYLVFFGVILAIYVGFIKFRFKPDNLNYNEFITTIEKGEVKKVIVTPNSNRMSYEIRGLYKDDKNKSREGFITRAPLSDEALSKIIKGKEGKLNYEVLFLKDPGSSKFFDVIINFLPLLLIGGFLFWMINAAQIQGGGKGLDFVKTPAKLSTNPDTTFKKVAGLKEEKEELREMIDFLKNPEKFKIMGARIPKGVLLVGPPGTGKTLLAKAVAGEAEVPFFYTTGSDFLELYVGVGASRVRDLFKEAKKNAPCLVFIDEIDTIGRRRGSGNGGGHDEREQTLNQFLSEMDGFEENEGIIVMAATNRPDVLDPALLRAGRFDRQVTVELPDKNSRKEILEVHAKNKTFASDVSLTALASRTPGFSGADLENVLNEAALLAVRRGKKKITMDEIDEGTDRVMGGPAKVSKKYTDKEKKLVAYHEAGHAVIGIKLKDAEKVHKITIIPRGDAGGYTLMLPKEETFLSTKSELLDRITGLYGGRASEELFFDDVTTGAHNDFEKATKLARALVTEYGMSSLGPIQYVHTPGDYYLGDYDKVGNYSEVTSDRIDKEVEKILNTAYDKAKKILKENEDLVSLLAHTLIEKETLTMEEIDSLVATGKLPSEKTMEELTKEAKDLKVKNYSTMTKEELIKAIDEARDK